MKAFQQLFLCQMWKQTFISCWQEYLQCTGYTSTNLKTTMFKTVNGSCRLSVMEFQSLDKPQRRSYVDQRRVLHFYFYERLHIEISKWANNLWLRDLSSTYLLQQTEQKAKFMAGRWRHWVNICYEKVVLSEYNNVSVINMLQHLMLK